MLSRVKLDTKVTVKGKTTSSSTGAGEAAIGVTIGSNSKGKYDKYSESEKHIRERSQSRGRSRGRSGGERSGGEARVQSRGRSGGRKVETHHEDMDEDLEDWEIDHAEKKGDDGWEDWEDAEDEKDSDDNDGWSDCHDSPKEKDDAWKRPNYLMNDIKAASQIEPVGSPSELTS